MSSIEKKQKSIRQKGLVKEAAMSKPWLPERWDYKADVVVVGCGGAGACAAIAAHNAGAKVLVLEKAPVGGGNTLVSGGGMTIPTNVAGAFKYYKALTRGTVDDGLTRAFAEAMANLPHKLEEWGAELEYFPAKASYPSFPGSDAFHQQVHLGRTERQKNEGMRWTHGDDLFYFLEKQVKQRNIRVMYETPAKHLVQDAVTKEILGVRAERRGAGIYIKATKGVVLACGGFQNNKEMLLNFLPHATALPIYPLGTPYNTGDGITMTAEAGAKLWHMNGAEFGIFGPVAPAKKFGVGFRLIRQLPTGSQAIYVNKYGKRFMDESKLLSHRKEPFEVQYFDQERAEYPNVPFYLVFDETYRKKGPIIELRGWWLNLELYKWSEDNSKEIEQGWIVKSDTLMELAGKIGVNAVSLEETVRKYNQGCKSGKDPEFARPEAWLVPMENPPYYATELCEPLINTQGGPKHNALAQVLDRDDKPIPRLYAAGELGSFFAPLYEVCSNVPEALAFGCIAGEQAAALKPWE